MYCYTNNDNLSSPFINLSTSHFAEVRLENSGVSIILYHVPENLGEISQMFNKMQDPKTNQTVLRVMGGKWTIHIKFAMS